MGSAVADYKFEGWQALDAKAAEGNMVWKEFEPKKWEETDVDIKITHSGICGSDIHTLRSGWVCLTNPPLATQDGQGHLHYQKEKKKKQKLTSYRALPLTP
jgi:hypothetical protein